jgi:DNA-binding protein H-NS
MDLNSLDLKELKKLEAEVSNRIATYEDRKIAEARAVLEATAREFGFSLSELTGGKASKRSRSSVAPKYAHPENASLTWTGRGRKPKWIVEALNAGKSLADLAI